ncbi:MAG: ThiF family adenylyltransferase [Campylobacter sp.]|nr:ThiF family adenylyltransferase [Campylobacter sp.]
MNNYFTRQIQLWGEAKQESLKSKKILIIGSGGLGSSLAYALGASGIGSIDVVDFDTVSTHNIHRQILFSMQDDGRYKADIFKERVEARYDGVKVRVHKVRFDEFATKCSEKFDLILDATDNNATRKQIAKFAKDSGVVWLHTSVEDFYFRICLVKESNFDKIHLDGIKPRGLAAPIVMMAAACEANFALRYLLDLTVKFDTLFYVDLNSGGIVVKELKL